jgi:branched-chain amino acid transport system permease protein
MSDLILPVLVNGCTVALVALAFHLVFRATGGIVDFAIGQYVIIGGLTAALASDALQLNTFFVLVLGCLAAATVAVVNERVVIRPAIMLNRDPLSMAPVLATVSLLMVWEQISRMVFGDVPVRGPSFFPGVRYALGEVLIPAHSVIIVATTVVIFVLIRLWLSRTRSGRMLRAVGDNRVGAELLGLPINRSRVALLELQVLLYALSPDFGHLAEAISR